MSINYKTTKREIKCQLLTGGLASGSVAPQKVHWEYERLCPA